MHVTFTITYFTDGCSLTQGKIDYPFTAYSDYTEFEGNTLPWFKLPKYVVVRGELILEMLTYKGGACDTSFKRSL